MKLEVKNLRKVFLSDNIETVALNDVSLTVQDGEFVAVMGPSGCGKSSLLNILGLLDKPTSGSYSMGGVEMSGINESERTRLRRGKIGFIFQAFNLIENMTVRENILLPLTNLEMNKIERNAKVEEIMKRMGIAHRANHYPSQLSGGQQQRVAIARAVVSNPGVILADEPTGNLDSKMGNEVMDLLDDLHREGATIVMVTHSPKDAERADYIINLYDGQIVSSLADKL